MTKIYSELWNLEKENGREAFWHEEADKFNNAQDGLNESLLEKNYEFHLKNLRNAAMVLNPLKVI